ncbi:bacteriophage Mu Gp45 protein [Haemophilus pittmaniae HK 85]|uniref:Bacteriophage Mu Gp45 protein n=1 Tax=Haemophilus pittmaniae HK 85 TaxID=1035188 RepID=F9Q9Q2_9PAST|nr:phage baseplate assembly protein V [Haemophilus pittmaniae]EGV05762.1 bacteriophage Mu Gp45 protein [Haemophilus pittmaniae HK 85]SNV67064.1 phage baseplate assembly protein V [Haemophilus pittmaniae]
MDGLNKVLAPLKRGLKSLISRAVVSIVTDSFSRQNLQVRLQADEVVDDVERFQNYGHSSVPLGGEAIVLSVGGKRSHLVAIVVEDKDVRPTGLKPGDSVLYHAEGHQLLLTESGEAILTCKKFTVNADEINFDAPQTQFSGDVTIMGTSTATDHLSDGKSGANHDHEKGVGKPV